MKGKKTTTVSFHPKTIVRAMFQARSTRQIYQFELPLELTFDLFNKNIQFTVEQRQRIS